MWEKGIEPVAYTRNQLQIIGSKEEYPTKSVIRGSPKKWVIEKITGKVRSKAKYILP